MKDFKLLKAVLIFNQVIGAISIIVGIIYAIVTGIYEPLLPDHHFGFFNDGLQIIYGLSISLIGLVWICEQEVIKVFLFIEKNTRN